jgi:hypothetical protein
LRLLEVCNQCRIDRDMVLRQATGPEIVRHGFESFCE